MSELSQWHTIPVYGGRLEIVISDDLDASRNSKKRLQYLSRVDCSDTFALVSNKGPITGIFFKIGKIDNGILSHEILHCATFILDRAGVEFDPDNQEAYTYFVQVITTTVYDDFERWGIPVPNDYRKGLARLPRQIKKNKKLSKRPNKG